MAKYIPIATVTVGSGGAASIEFTSIPQTYTDLVLKLSLRNDYPAVYATNVCHRFNDSTTGYSARDMYGYGTGYGSGSYTTLAIAGSNWARPTDGGIPTPTQTSNVFAITEMYLPNYTSANYKSYSYELAPENDASSSYDLAASAGLWSNTAAITSIKFAPYNGSFVQYSTATLYGI